MNNENSLKISENTKQNQDNNLFQEEYTPIKSTEGNFFQSANQTNNRSPFKFATTTPEISNNIQNYNINNFYPQSPFTNFPGNSLISLNKFNLSSNKKIFNNFGFGFFNKNINKRLDFDVTKREDETSSENDKEKPFFDKIIKSIPNKTVNLNEDGNGNVKQMSEIEKELFHLKKIRCKCKKSKCIKLYCECLANNEVCIGCECENCDNRLKTENISLNVNNISKFNYDAFGLFKKKDINNKNANRDCDDNNDNLDNDMEIEMKMDMDSINNIDKDDHIDINKENKNRRKTINSDRITNQTEPKPKLKTKTKTQETIVKNKEKDDINSNSDLFSNENNVNPSQIITQTPKNQALLNEKLSFSKDNNRSQFSQLRLNESSYKNNERKATFSSDYERKYSQLELDMIRTTKKPEGNQNQVSLGCNCYKSNCRKKYCECFKSKVSCNENCRCFDCENIYNDKDFIKKHAFHLNYHFGKYNNDSFIKGNNVQIEKISIEISNKTLNLRTSTEFPANPLVEVDKNLNMTIKKKVLNNTYGVGLNSNSSMYDNKSHTPHKNSSCLTQKKRGLECEISDENGKENEKVVLNSKSIDSDKKENLLKTNKFNSDGGKMRKYFNQSSLRMVNKKLDLSKCDD